MTKAQLRDRLETMLLLVLENHQEYIASESLDRLTMAQMTQIIKWGAVMMYEASDNDCRARCAPKALRDLLPPDHYLQKWRMPRQPARI